MAALLIQLYGFLDSQEILAKGRLALTSGKEKFMEQQTLQK